MRRPRPDRQSVADLLEAENLAQKSTTGNKVLVVDCDTQRNIFDFFNGDANVAGVQKTRYEKISVALWSEELVSDFDNFDYVILDLPPSADGYVKGLLEL